MRFSTKIKTGRHNWRFNHLKSRILRILWYISFNKRGHNPGVTNYTRTNRRHGKDVDQLRWNSRLTDQYLYSVTNKQDKTKTLCFLFIGTVWFWRKLECPLRSKTISFKLSNNGIVMWVTTWFQVQCRFASTETMKTIGDGEPRTTTSTFTQLLSSDVKLLVIQVISTTKNDSLSAPVWMQIKLAQ